jgi:rhodanese-related sulfurtransferase
MNSITPSELKERLDKGEEIVLIDVRERWEHDIFNIGGEVHPLSDPTLYIEEINHNKPIVFYCQKGIRSMIAIQRLQHRLPCSNLINLSGGMDAWLREHID